MTIFFLPPGDLVIIILFTKPVFIKFKYEFIYSTHTLIAKICSSYEASVCVGVFMKLTTGSQSKGSSIVALNKSSRGGGLGIYRAHLLTHELMLGLYYFLIIFLIAQKIHHVQ